MCTLLYNIIQQCNFPPIKYGVSITSVGSTLLFLGESRVATPTNIRSVVGLFSQELLKEWEIL